MIKRIVPMLLAILCLTACGNTKSFEPVASETFFAMNTIMNISIYEGEAEMAEAAKELINELEKKISVTDSESEVYRLNANGYADISADLFYLLTHSYEACRMTGGALDITIYPLVRAWGFTTDEKRVPSEGEIDDLLRNVGYKNIELSSGGAGPSVNIGDCQVDLGSTAKGFAGDKLRELCEGKVSSALIDLGGNIVLIGGNPDGKPWRVGVKNPLGEGNVGVVEVSNLSVITSGGYERCFEQDGETYTHIIDPATGYPAKSGLASVTILGMNGLYADGFSTAFYVMGLEKSIEVLKLNPMYEAIFVTDDGEIYITPGLKNNFTAEKGWTVNIIER